MDTKTLDKIKSAAFPATPEGKILAEAQKVIGDITDGFTKPGNLSTHKIDLTNKVEAAGFTVEQYESVFGSIKRSEADAVQYVADQVAAEPKSSSLAKAKLALVKVKLKLQLQLSR